MKSQYVEFPWGVTQKVWRDSGFLTKKRETIYHGVIISPGEYDVRICLFNNDTLETPDTQELLLPPNSEALRRVANMLLKISDEMEK